MKEIKNYAEKIAAKVKDYLPEEYKDAEVNVIEVRKGRTICNQVSVIRPEEIAGINVTVNDFFPFFSTEEAAEKVAEMIRDHKEQVFDLQSLKDSLSTYSSLSSKIYIRLYSSEMAIEYPYKMITDDLAAVYYICPEAGESMTVNVTHAMLNAWGVSFENVLEAARTNMLAVYDYRSMYDTMKGMIKDMIDTKLVSAEEVEEMLDDIKYSPMSVLTNKGKLFGAGMLAVPLALEKAFGTKRRLILPSSIHEVITLPYGYISPEQAKEMVQAVNTEQVPPEEQLSDSVYIYINGELKKI